jgi:hypothetical protein
MREDAQRSADDFAIFIRDEANRNVMAKTLAGHAQINVTADAFLIDPQPFEAEIRALNAADQAPFAFVTEHEELPPPVADDSSAHPLTVILYQNSGADGLQTQSLSSSTERLRRDGVVAADLPRGR